MLLLPLLHQCIQTRNDNAHNKKEPSTIEHRNQVYIIHRNVSSCLSSLHLALQRTVLVVTAFGTALQQLRDLEPVNPFWQHGLLGLAPLWQNDMFLGQGNKLTHLKLRFNKIKRQDILLVTKSKLFTSSTDHFRLKFCVGADSARHARHRCAHCWAVADPPTNSATWFQPCSWYSSTPFAKRLSCTNQLWRVVIHLIASWKKSNSAYQVGCPFRLCLSLRGGGVCT